MENPDDFSQRVVRAVNRGHRWFMTGMGFLMIFVMIEKFWPKSYVAHFVRAIWP